MRNGGFRALGLGFRVLGFGAFSFLGFGFQAFWVLGFRAFEVLGFWAFEFVVANTGSPPYNTIPSN